MPPIIGSISSPDSVARGAVDHLQEGRQIAGGAEERDADDGADQAGDVEDGVAEQPQRDERFGGEVLDDEEEQGAAEPRRRPRPRMTREPQAYSVPPQLVSSTRQVENDGEQQRAERRRAGARRAGRGSFSTKAMTSERERGRRAR